MTDKPEEIPNEKFPEVEITREEVEKRIRDFKIETPRPQGWPLTGGIKGGLRPSTNGLWKKLQELEEHLDKVNSRVDEAWEAIKVIETLLYNLNSITGLIGED